MGSREFENYDLVCAKVAKIQKTQKIDLIVSGGAKGADTQLNDVVQNRKDWLLTADEALALGIIIEIISL